MDVNGVFFLKYFGFSITFVFSIFFKENTQNFANFCLFILIQKAVIHEEQAKPFPKTCSAVGSLLSAYS